jgi:hypothetical protein
MRFEIGGVRDEELAVVSKCSCSVFNIGTRHVNPNVVCIRQELEQITGTTANLEHAITRFGPEVLARQRPS